jgi:hypothetical protein
MLTLQEQLIDASALVAKFDLEIMVNDFALKFFTDGIPPQFLLDRPDFVELCEAISYAGYSLAEQECEVTNQLLLGNTLFEEAYCDGMDIFEEYRRERQAEHEEWLSEQRAQALRVETKKMIDENRWEELGLPTPEELSALLYSGESTHVCEHFLVYEKEEEMLWYTNPYGCDGGLGKEPTVKCMRSFLTRVALGGMYGPSPDY